MEFSQTIKFQSRANNTNSSTNNTNNNTNNNKNRISDAESLVLLSRDILFRLAQQVGLALELIGFYSDRK